MTANLVARLEAEADLRDFVWTDTPTVNAPSKPVYSARVRALLREAASALRSSGEAVGYLITWNDGTKQVSVDPCHADDGNCVPLYLHPATVTDEDVERACIVMSRIGEDTEWPADYDDADQAAIRHFMRAALESFVRKQPAASAALESV